ncbi:hypothetical protein AMATHDRAFT_54443 [Amanita thiersii Skay4041]|uniref:SHSP domain-containing protein n=1 Tax=Amanita thiersii Skay4041 TaxID=703135 RepID=A0A2A9NTK6_9AGAR|nr:hypothetical protein AMATHDRAFT_54443 [Amanita thiersii Skay4041]
MPPRSTTKQIRYMPYPVINDPQVLRLANVLAVSACRQALKSGRIRLVNPSSASHMFIPRMDVWDDPSSSIVEATFELPGVKSNNISLSIQNGIMQVRGRRYPRVMHAKNSSHASHEVAAQNDSEDDSILQPDPRKHPVQELRYGSFQRDLELPKDVKESEITASLRDGLLVVTWPRTPASKPDDSKHPIDTNDSNASAPSEATSR